MKKFLTKISNVELIIETEGEDIFSFDNLELWTKLGRLEITDYITDVSFKDRTICFKIALKK